MSTAGAQHPSTVLVCDQPDVLAAWLRAQGEPVAGEVRIARVGFGQSNITTVVTDESDREWVLREPPPGPRAQSTHDVVREARIVDQLANSGIPVPRVVGTGVTPGGAGFFVMERVAGAPLESEADAAALSPEQRRGLGLRVIETLARLHTIDPAAVGLTDLARASQTSYVGRQIRRLSASWDHTGRRSAHDQVWHNVRTQLDATLPPAPPLVLIHGDFRLSNLLVQGADITAVLDWELSTLGDPLADLAWLLDDWRQPDEPAISMPSPTRAGDFPARAELIDVYRGITGFNVDRIGFYRGFTQWRAATLLQGVAVRRSSGSLGTHGDLDLDELDHTIAVLLDAAASNLQAAT
ncbi:phosphotransferase family protein [Mycobacterium sp. AT1]|uniref:phosphotransferase family protein n=1 Tax=Mycobacterium sp. AT1 TaxID=1961706 RepID=UPI0009AE31C7|nr:phosphotransferase family protein [Mycobacterium sp. AT1]OPX12376.1 phosphotransferase family protein [Mycobacterium sp. AT1]